MVRQEQAMALAHLACCWYYVPMNNSLNGIYAASITPFDQHGRLASEALASHLRHLETNGCDGAVILGTTGEGPSLSVDERIEVFKAAAAQRGKLKLMAGTGATSLTDAINLTAAAFDLGYDSVLIIPPFYFKSAGIDGLFDFYSQVIDMSVPTDGKVLLYHFPQMSGVAIEAELIKRLRNQYPDQVTGIKDSSGSPQNARMLCREFDDFMVFVGDDKLLADTLADGGAGGISALANVYPALLAAVLSASRDALSTDEAQAKLNMMRGKMDGLNLPGAVLAKVLLGLMGILPNDSVRSPLRTVSEQRRAKLKELFDL